MENGLRFERRSGRDVADSSNRRPAQRDRDRILYAESFRRLGGVTQVALGPADMSLHNRLVHSLKVEQVGTSLVSRLVHGNEGVLGPLIDSYVVAAACLAHDLGHPPFGHAGEQELQRVLTCESHRKKPRSLAQRIDQPCRNCKLEDSFEGNAQSFRILTALAVHRSSYDGDEGSPASLPIGLDLTRATLMASTKYPWARGGNDEKPKKWGAYDCDAPTLQWAAEVDGVESIASSLEAQIMDWADDISYAVHDIEDFFRVGLVPLNDYHPNSTQLERFLAYAQVALGKLGEDVLTAFSQLMDIFPTTRFESKIEDMVVVDNLRSTLLSQFIEAASVSNDLLAIERVNEQDQINSLLKQLIWYHIIDEPKLANIQAGQQRVLSDLFEALEISALEAYSDESASPDEQRLRRLPPGLRRAIGVGLTQRNASKAARSATVYSRNQQIVRGVVDYLSSLSDAEAYKLHAVLRGREVAGHL